MTRYTATISHHSISRARIIDAGDTLLAAKRAATREFGDGYNDHVIVIYDTTRRPGDQMVASRRMDCRKWADL